MANSSSLVQLGKALFWDMQVGNDGKQACASCHFHAGTGRNAPTVINAVFNVRNFWDARAKNMFTVFTPFGDSDVRSNIVLESGGTLQATRIRLDNSSLASQSVGPALSSVEMSSAGRSWQKLGRKDTGYFHTGVRPVSDDPGLAGNDGFNVPLSLAAQQNPSKAGVGGAFKTPTIRNTELTGPFFRNGSTATLEQVVDFYNRGGDTPTDLNLGPGIQPLSLSASDKSALVEFMKALSDDRVRFEKAPFDHPQFCVANGEKTPVTATSDPQFTPEAVDNMVEIPAVGKSGGSAPLQTFGELIGASTATGLGHTT